MNEMLSVLQTYERTGIQRAASDLVQEMDKYKVLATLCKIQTITDEDAKIVTHTEQHHYVCQQHWSHHSDFTRRGTELSRRPANMIHF
jgi:N-acetylmuramoyl-L-alanine amidase CwlA